MPKQDFIIQSKKNIPEDFEIPKEPEVKHLPDFLSWFICAILIMLSIASIVSYAVYYLSANQVIKENLVQLVAGNLTPTSQVDILKQIAPDKVNSNKFDISTSASGLGIYELKTNKVIYEKSADIKMPFASITKLLTVEAMESVLDKSSPIIMDSVGVNIYGTAMNVSAGEKIPFNDAIYAMMLPSSNGVAFSVAKQYGYEEFLSKMSGVIKALNLSNTSVTSPIGFDDPNNYSTVRDIFTISKLFLKSDTNKSIVKTIDYTVKTDKGSYPIKNTNDLLTNAEVYGLKTGTEDKAGQCLVLYVRIGTREYIAVILGSSDRFKEGQSIVNWLKTNG